MSRMSVRSRWGPAWPSRLALVLWASAVLAAGAACSAASGPVSGGDATGFRTFEGAWFAVDYPEAFTPKPSLPSTTADGWDSAEFVSPGGAVAFYVFSPQWGGEPSDIAIDPEREVLSGEKRQATEGGEVRWSTICARDGSYCRSYRDTVSGEGSVRTVVGIRYRSEADRRRHAEAYDRFRRSLRQFAD